MVEGEVIPPEPQPGSSPKTLTSRQLIAAAFHFSGPLPPPEILNGYEQVLPGSADRIIRMAEGQASHRQAIERGEQQSERRLSYAGVAAALLIGLTGLGASTAMALAGHEASAVAIGGTTLVSLCGTFIYGARSRRKEQTETLRSVLEAARLDDPSSDRPEK